MILYIQKGSIARKIAVIYSIFRTVGKFPEMSPG